LEGKLRNFQLHLKLTSLHRHRLFDIIKELDPQGYKIAWLMYEGEGGTLSALDLIMSGRWTAILNFKNMAFQYLQVVKKNRIIPQVIRTDRGGETVLLAGMQYLFSRTIRGEDLLLKECYAYGTSTANERGMVESALQRSDHKLEGKSSVD
jgi:hypothetical protein